MTIIEQVLAFLGGGARVWPPRRLSLALQGGGSFGAFTAGVLDRLLDEPDIDFDAASGASAGAVNAVLLASGLIEGRAAAKARLERFWKRMSQSTAFLPKASLASLMSAAPFLHLLSLSPYQFNPFNLDPLRDALAAEIDFAELRAKAPMKLLIGATRVRDGKLRIFEAPELTIESVLASACLPLIHHTVEIAGEPYWDGGYAANPPLLPLVQASERRPSPDRAGDADRVRTPAEDAARNRAAAGANPVQRDAQRRAGGDQARDHFARDPEAAPAADRPDIRAGRIRRPRTREPRRSRPRVPRPPLAERPQRGRDLARASRAARAARRPVRADGWLWGGAS